MSWPHQRALGASGQRCPPFGQLFLSVSSALGAGAEAAHMPLPAWPRAQGSVLTAPSMGLFCPEHPPPSGLAGFQLGFGLGVPLRTALWGAAVSCWAWKAVAQLLALHSPSGPSRASSLPGEPGLQSADRVGI